MCMHIHIVYVIYVYVTVLHIHNMHVCMCYHSRVAGWQDRLSPTLPLFPELG